METNKPTIEEPEVLLPDAPSHRRTSGWYPARRQQLSRAVHSMIAEQYNKKCLRNQQDDVEQLNKKS